MTAAARGPARAATAIALALLALSAATTRAFLFRQDIRSDTDRTRQIPAALGAWRLVAESAPTASEYRGLETRDLVKRTYTDGHAAIGLVVAYIGHSDRKSAHAQEACLRGAGAMVSDLSARRLRGLPVTANDLAIEAEGRKSRVFYWYKFGGEYASDYLRASLRMFLAGAFGRHAGGTALIRLVTPEAPGEDPERARARLEDFAAALVPELDRLLP